MSKLLPTRTIEAFIREMTTEEFLCFLREKDIQIQEHQGRLKINAPAAAIDAPMREELTRRKAALLEMLTASRGAAASREAGEPGPLVALTAAELCMRIPLTPAQQGMWLIDHFSPGNVAYNIPEAFRFDQSIEFEVFQRAVERLIDRHGILRTSFQERDGDLFQSISPTAEAEVCFTDLSAFSELEGERRCRESIRNEGRRPFDLKQAPLVRFQLYRLGGTRHVVFLNIHHIIADRISLYVLRKELVALCIAGQNGGDAELHPVHLQFADYACWLTRQMQGEAMAVQIAHWKKKFAGLPAPLELPHSRPRPEQRTYCGATRPIFVSLAAREAMNRIGAEEGASPFMTFLALFAVSLARWSQGARAGAADFCVGSPITQRKDIETGRMIGPFVNMLAFRCRVGPGMSFRDMVRQVRETALEAYENSDVPFQRLVREVNPDRGSQRSPIFQVMFGYETYLPPVADEFKMDADPGTARYDLALHLYETASEGLTGAIEYCTDLFDGEDIEGLAAQGEAVAAAIVGDPGRELGAIPVTVRDLSVRGVSIVGTAKVGSHGAAVEENGAAFVQAGRSGSGTSVRGRIARLFSRP